MENAKARSDENEIGDVDRPSRSRWTRRGFLSCAARGIALPTLGWPLLSFLGSPARGDHHEGRALPTRLLEESPYAYISPLRRDGEESRCHGEVWFAWLDESVVTTVASDRWKAKALAQGLDRARIWVGDHGRWKTMLGGRNEEFRKAPSFDARAERISDEAMIDRLLASYGRKYPKEIGDWRDRMKRGNADGSRIMIRYTPI
jgi:hypothetical protein